MSNNAPHDASPTSIDLDALEARWKAEGKNYWAGGKLEAFDSIEEAVEVIPQLIARIRELEYAESNLQVSRGLEKLTKARLDTLEAANALQGRTITQWADLLERQGALLNEAERALDRIAENDAAYGNPFQIARDALAGIRAAKGGTE